MQEGAGRFERIVTGFELVAGSFLAIVTALTFASVVLRYAFNWGIPDAFDLSRNLLGVIIFWGIALAGYRGDHITVDLVWGALGPRARRAVDLLATLLTIACMAVFAWMMGDKVMTTRADNVLTFDLHLPVWLFFLLAWLGILGAVPLLLVRLWRLVTSPLGAESARPEAPLRVE